MTKDELFSRTEYRRVIAWPERIRREAPFFAQHFDGIEPRRVLDVGCGTGEHARHLAEQGFVAIGVDVSEKMIEDAQDHAGTTDAGGSVRYELRDAADAAALPEAPFGAALCIGNGLAFQYDAAELDRLFAGVAGALAPGAPFLMQLLNYERIVGQNVRSLPINVRPLPEEEGDGEIVFVRIFAPGEDGILDFFPITLTLEPDADPPVRVRNAKRGKHRAWTAPDLEKALTSAGFGRIQRFGSMTGDPYSPNESHDLVLVAHRA